MKPCILGTPPHESHADIDGLESIKVRPPVHLLYCANSEDGNEKMIFDKVKERNYGGIDSIYKPIHSIQSFRSHPTVSHVYLVSEETGNGIVVALQYCLYL